MDVCMTGPVSHTYQWQHSPHIVRMPFSCNLESARTYLEAESRL